MEVTKQDLTFAESDAVELFEIINRNRERLRAWLPWVDGTRESADVAGFLRRALAENREGKALHHAIRCGIKIVGFASLNSIDRDRGEASVGFWIDAEHEGRGLVTQAVAALCENAFGGYGLRVVELCAGVDNVRSQRVAARLGFVQRRSQPRSEWLYDRWIDRCSFEMTAERWRSR